MSDHPAVHRDAFWMLAGERLGNGMARAVYRYRPDPECVLKVEEDARSFYNQAEWSIWEAVEWTPFAKWFAPCVDIGPSGIVLLMKRTTPIPEARLPKLMPAFFSDFKPDNYGYYKGRIVCHDYGHNWLIERGLTKAMKTVNWR